MKAKIGSLAIAKFGGKHNNVVCIVTGKSASRYQQGYFSFFYWEKNEQGITIFTDSLPTGRLISVQPKGNWDGSILKLTIDNVEPT